MHLITCHHIYHLIFSISSRIFVSVMSASATPMSVEGVGSIFTPYISSTDVYYIPTSTLNLSSVTQLCKSSCRVFFLIHSTVYRIFGLGG